MKDLGLGLCTLGFSPFGYGEPYNSPAQVAISGDTTRSTVDGDFQLDENGNFIKESSVAMEMVKWCLGTKFDSSAIPGFGNNILSLQTIPESSNLQIKNMVLSCLDLVIRQGVIDQVEVSTEIRNSKMVVLVSYYDMVSKQNRVFII